MLRKASLLSVAISSVLFGAQWARAEGSVSPYIDHLKAKLEAEGKESGEPVRTQSNPDPYIQSLREKMRQEGKLTETPSGTQPYIDQLKAKHPELNEDNKSKGYTKNAQEQMGPSEPGGAIQAVHDGHSELQLKRPGKINASIGIKVGTAVSHGFTGDSTVVANNFTSIYGTKWVPDLTFSAEYKPFYSEIYGSLGLVGLAGFTIFKGKGQFGYNIQQPSGGGSFGTESRTKLTYLSFPITLGAKYQFNLGHYVRPYALVGPSVVAMSENRNDGVNAHKALSKGVTTSAGAAIMLDWISGTNSWNYYQDFGIKHYYLTIEYSKLTTVSSPVDVSYSGLTAGFSFDL